jgi:predicted MFS family arabinose efflux permease
MAHPASLVAAGTALIASCYGLARFTYGLFSPDFATEFHLSPTMSGALGSGGYIGYCVAIVVATALTPRWGARNVAVLAGSTATLGIATVAASTSAIMLAIGILVAGSSTGIASPPIAAAVAQWISADRRDRAQILVNSGTGVGVLLSGPIALALRADWRSAWAIFAVLSALVTMAVWRYVPGDDSSSGAAIDGPATPGRLHVRSGRLMACSAALGLGSIAVWTLGRQVITEQGGMPVLAAAVWTALGAAGLVGAVAGPVVARLGITSAWLIGMAIMGTSTVAIAFFAGQPAVAVISAVAFGASYIALTGVLLVWATRVFPDRVASGVGRAFLAVAAGQAVGSLLAGSGVQNLSTTTVFVTCAVVTALGAALAPRR